MLRVLVIRLAIFALPFVVYFVWREAARRSGRPMGSTPWPWLVALGAGLAAASLIGTVVLRRPEAGTYVPAQVRADGSVAPGRFVPATPKSSAGAVAPMPSRPDPDR